MVLTAVAMAFQLDIRFQTAIADHLPAALVNPTHVARDVGRACTGSPARPRPALRRDATAGDHDAHLRDYGPAPDFTGNAALVQHASRSTLAGAARAASC